MNYDPITHQEALKIRADLAAMKLQLNGAKPLMLLQSQNFVTSRTWIAPQDGIVVVRAMGAGGSGAKGSNATGGYSGSWGLKTVSVKKGDTITVSIGAGGAAMSTVNSNGNAGGNTTVTINGVTYIAYGGPGGVYNSAAALPNGPAPSSNWDFGASSVKPGWIAGSMCSGGAGVDILAQGNNATTSDAVVGSLGSGGAGTGAASVGVNGGGAVGITSMMLQRYANDLSGIFFDAGNGEWGISFFGGSGGGGGGGSGNAGPGGNGGGGGGNSGNNTYRAGDGGAGGGGGSVGPGTGSGSGGSGGLGGGGGATGSTTGAPTAGKGGDGYAHLKFFVFAGV